MGEFILKSIATKEAMEMNKKHNCAKELKRIGEVIAELRKDHKLTQALLAERAGIAKSTLANIELGNFNFEISSLISVLGVLDEPVVYVLYRAIVEPKLIVADVKERMFIDVLKMFIRGVFRHIR